METRRRSVRASFGADRPYTKKERESLGKTATCPPVSKKCPMRLHLANTNRECAISLSYKNNGALDEMYDKKSDVPYLNQVFNVVGIIGEGSFGIVYKAVKKDEDVEYAIKVSKQRGVKGMINEVKKLEKIGFHPNFVKYIFAWKEMGNVFIQFEYCLISLAKYSRYNHKIMEMELWDIFLDMVLALKHLHEKRFVHLDIKPDNILIGVDGTYKLGDFGLLVDMLEIGENKKARYDKISEGDAKYLPREVLEGQYSPAGDMFSLGITLLELAADLVLPTNGHLWHKLRNGDIPAHYLMVVPESLQKIICHLMLANFKKRPLPEEIMNWRDVKKKLSRRGKGGRPNYYQEWLSKRGPNDSMPELEEVFETPLDFEMQNNNNYGFTLKKLMMKHYNENITDKNCNLSTSNISRQLNFEVDDDEEKSFCEEPMDDLNIDTPPSSKQGSLKSNNSSLIITPCSTSSPIAETSSASTTLTPTGGGGEEVEAETEDETMQMQLEENSSPSTPNVPSKRVSKMILFSL